jgi:hypothetical protein
MAQDEAGDAVSTNETLTTTTNDAIAQHDQDANLTTDATTSESGEVETLNEIVVTDVAGGGGWNSYKLYNRLASI